MASAYLMCLLAVIACERTNESQTVRASQNTRGPVLRDTRWRSMALERATKLSSHAYAVLLAEQKATLLESWSKEGDALVFFRYHDYGSEMMAEKTVWRGRNRFTSFYYYTHGASYRRTVITEVGSTKVHIESHYQPSDQLISLAVVLPKHCAGRPPRYLLPLFEVQTLQPNETITTCTLQLAEPERWMEPAVEDWRMKKHDHGVVTAVSGDSRYIFNHSGMEKFVDGPTEIRPVPIDAVAPEVRARAVAFGGPASWRAR